MRLVPLGLTFAAVVTASAALAQSGEFVGRVQRDSAGTPIGGADVAIVVLKRGTTTNFLGEFRLAELPPGRHLVVVRFIGFVPWEDTVEVVAGRPTFRELVLTPTTVTLDSVKVTAPAKKYISPALTAFEERRKAHVGGYFIAEDELRKDDGRVLTNLITSHASGLTSVPAAGGAAYLVSTRACAPRALSCAGRPSCWVTVYQDGVRIYDPTTSPLTARLDFNRMSANEFAAIEFYPGGASVPPQYNVTGSVCGTLLLWTRER